MNRLSFDMLYLLHDYLDLHDSVIMSRVNRRFYSVFKRRPESNEEEIEKKCASSNEKIKSYFMKVCKSATCFFINHLPGWPFNADFDGDEMHSHDMVTASEVYARSIYLRYAPPIPGFSFNIYEN